MKRIVVALTLVLSSVITFATGNWIAVAASDSPTVYCTWETYSTSAVYGQNDSGEDIRIAHFRMNTISKPENILTITYDLKYVVLTECIARTGTLYSVTLDGELQYTNHFTINGNTVTDILSTVLCRDVINRVEQQSDEVDI
jgi:hypothetical protein